MVFLDRDGTLIDDVGYIKHSSESAFYSFTFEALHYYWSIFIVHYY